MRRPSHIMRPLLCSIALSLLTTSPAASAIGVDPSESRPPTVPQRASGSQPHPGDWCPIGGCKPPPNARFSDVAAFGGAIFLAAWLSRRQLPSPL